MPYQREYSWSEVKRLIADSEARASPFTFHLATLSYAAEKATYDAAMLAYAPQKAAWEATKQEAIAKRKAAVADHYAKHPGTKPKLGPLNVPAAPTAPKAPSLPVAADFHGHASSMHHAFSDEQLQQRSVANTVASAFTKEATVDGGVRVRTQDQSILIRAILNSKLGQAALGALDGEAAPARLMITQAESLDVNMRVAKGGAATASTGIRQIKLILDSGAASLHVVTCYPCDAAENGDRFMSDSGYSVSVVAGGGATAGPSARWSTQTNAAIP
jgi:hypothetical protein